MDPKSELMQFKQKIDLELEQYFKAKESQYATVSKFIQQYIIDLAQFTLIGGKRLRPALIYHSYKMFGGTDEAAIIKLSIFIELIQSFLLMHDDIIDNSDLRRGGPTMHKTYEKIALQNNYPNSSEFGIAMAILSGDLANQFAFEIISKSNFAAEKKLELINLVSQEISGVIFGEIHDVILPFQAGYTFEDIMRVHHYKTAKYTYEIPVVTGAILAGADPSDIEKLKEYSTNAGIAYQIHDDILGVFGDDEITGKPSLSDLKEGKKTLLTFKVEESGTENQKSTLKAALGNQNLTLEQAQEIKQIMLDTGSLDYSKQKEKDYVLAAQEALNGLKIEHSSSYNFLNKIIEYSISRSV